MISCTEDIPQRVIQSLSYHLREEDKTEQIEYYSVFMLNLNSFLSKRVVYILCSLVILINYIRNLTYWILGSNLYSLIDYFQLSIRFHRPPITSWLSNVWLILKNSYLQNDNESKHTLYWLSIYRNVFF